LIHTSGFNSGGAREGVGVVRSPPLGGVNLCLHVAHKQNKKLLYFSQNRSIVLQRTAKQARDRQITITICFTRLSSIHLPNRIGKLTPSVARKKGDQLVLLTPSDFQRQQVYPRSPYPTSCSGEVLLMRYPTIAHAFHREFPTIA
jgi:hypothetical protein